MATSERTSVIRKGAIIGAGLAAGVTAAVLGTRYEQNKRAVRPTLDVEWGRQVPFEETPEGQPVDLERHDRKELRKHLGVLTVNAKDLKTALGERPSRIALAVEGDQGIWTTGVFPEGAELGSSPEDSKAAVVALKLGNHAMSRGVHLGTVDTEGVFSPVETYLQEVAPGREVRREYPGIPVIAGPPERPHDVPQGAVQITTVPGNGQV